MAGAVARRRRRHGRQSGRGVPGARARPGAGTATAPDPGYGLEAPARPATPELLRAAEDLERTLLSLAAPLKELARILTQRIDDESETMETETRARIEAVCRGLLRRAAMVDAWAAMLHALEDGT